MAPPTARQIEYAMALGIEIPSRCDKDRISTLIDAAVKKLHGPPNAKQLKLIEDFGIDLPSALKSSSHAVDILYEHLKARRWVYSVIRHVVKAEWSRYSESGLPDDYANKIASDLKAQKKLMSKIEKRDGGNHASGGDVWYRITEKGVGSPEYLFVKNYELPDEVVAKINVSSAKRVRSGCLSILIFFCVLIFLYATTT